MNSAKEVMMVETGGKKMLTVLIVSRISEWS